MSVTSSSRVVNYKETTYVKLVVRSCSGLQVLNRKYYALKRTKKNLKAGSSKYNTVCAKLDNCNKVSSSGRELLESLEKVADSFNLKQSLPITKGSLREPALVFNGCRSRACFFILHSNHSQRKDYHPFSLHHSHCQALL